MRAADTPGAAPRQAADHARLAGALLVKLLQRGRTPLPTLEIEREALRVCGLLDAACDLATEGDQMGWELPPGARAAHERPMLFWRLSLTERPFTLDPAFDALLQSDVEARFLEHWVPEALGPRGGSLVHIPGIARQAA